jgi:hypothetical protein
MNLAMTSRICRQMLTERAFRLFAVATRNVIPVFFLIFVLSHAPNAAAADGKEKTSASPCAFSDAEFDTTTDVHALDEYRDAIAQLLKQEKFAELDCLADAARNTKAMFPGGGWKLRNIYIGLDSPRPGHPTQEDWSRHLELMERWTKQNPRSVTARIALADSYISFAWDARGDGYADSVSESGWKLFNERMDKAKTILDNASDLARKCPNWYLAMQRVARAQNWDPTRFKALFEQAIAFEPGYQYYYRVYADQLQPKWGGEEGDPARFAKEVADRVGGDAGDLLYFQIADAIVCACQETEFGHFSWPRLQKGFATLEKKDRASLLNVNSFALMASKSGDWVAADPAFKRIGEDWDQEKWVTEDFFKQNRDTAAQLATLQAKSQAYRHEAEANMKTQEGQAYLSAFNTKLTAFEKSCSDQSGGDRAKFELLVQIGKDGGAEDAHTETPPTPFALCIMRAMYDSHVRKQTPFPAPPKESYRLILEIDPAILNAAAK